MVTVAHLEMIENDDIFPRKPSSDHQSWAFTTVFPYIFLCMFTLNEMCIPGRKKNIAAKATKPAKVVENIAQGMGFQDFTKQTIFSPVMVVLMFAGAFSARWNRVAITSERWNTAWRWG